MCQLVADNELHPAERVHALSLANLDGEYATVVESTEVLAALPIGPS